MRLRHFLAVALMFGSEPALAYIGPGVGTGIIATVIGVLSALTLAVVGIVYFPIKRLLRSRRAKRSASKSESPPL